MTSDVTVRFLELKTTIWLCMHGHRVLITKTAVISFGKAKKNPKHVSLVSARVSSNPCASIVLRHVLLGPTFVFPKKIG